MIATLREYMDRDMRDFLAEARERHGFGKISPLLFSGIEDFTTRGGKKIRPLLFALSYLGYTDKKEVSLKAAVRASLSVELLHDFLLVHDDVIDKSALRRGKPTLHKVYNARLGEKKTSTLGSDLAIVAGDIIFALSVEALLDIDEPAPRKEAALREFMKAAALTGAGEFIDVVNSKRGIDEITRKDVFMTYDLKTAKYTFISPLVMGALLAGVANSETERLARLGLLLGRAFQIQDDLLDMFSSRKALGKPTLSDLDESKKTLLVWKAYHDLCPKDKKTLKRFLEKDNKCHKDLIAFRSLIKTSGAHTYCELMVRSLLNEAAVTLSSLAIKEEQKQLISSLSLSLFNTIQ